MNSGSTSEATKEPTEWSLAGFLSTVVDIHENMPERRFCFLLGAGASIQSGIPGARRIAHDWLQELTLRASGANSADDSEMERWAQSQDYLRGLTVKNVAEYYPKLYNLMFDGDPERGYNAIERLVERGRPSFGYTMLAQILEMRHSVVITPNFDNLLVEALYMYDAKHPLICGHENLAQFARAQLKRPLIAKIHGDYLLEPRSSQEAISQLPETWKNALIRIFETYTPIVIGYGGNDGGLMGFLNEFAERADKPLYWCYWKPEPPSERIRDLLGKWRGGSDDSDHGIR